VVINIPWYLGGEDAGTPQVNPSASARR
jgi:hypothetical protein